MAEIVAILVRGEGIGTIRVLVLAAQQVQKSRNVLAVYKFARVIDAEKLAEIESHVLVDILLEQSSEVVGVYVHSRQSFIRIRVAEMLQIPFGLGLLFHHVVPSIYLVLLVFVKEVERRA